MLSRALRLATVTLLIGCLTAVAVHAQENLEAGKTPAQIFAGTCNACHKSPRGLLKSVPASSLPGFLRQHYTTSIDMASVLSAYLVANGAADTRQQAKQGKDGAKDGTKEASRTPAEGAKQRPPRAAETHDPNRPDLMRPEPPAHAAVDKGKKDKGKKGRPEEPARTEPSAEPPKEAAKPAAEPKVESAKVEAAKETAGEHAATRPDPVPAVTPAPTSAAAPATAPGASSVPPVQPLDGPSTPVAEPLKSIIELPKPPAVAAAPALPPVPPAGPPTVPISQ